MKKRPNPLTARDNLFFRRLARRMTYEKDEHLTHIVEFLRRQAEDCVTVYAKWREEHAGNCDSQEAERDDILFVKGLDRVVDRLLSQMELAIERRDAEACALIGFHFGIVLGGGFAEVVLEPAIVRDRENRQRAAKEANESRRERQAERLEKRHLQAREWERLNRGLSPDTPRTERARFILRRAPGEPRDGRKWPTFRVIYDHLAMLETKTKPRRR